MNNFKELGIADYILKAIDEAGFNEPTDIQRKSIPLILKRKDVIGGSATGSGKTLAFGAGIIQNSEKCGRVQALVLTPTRELADQIAKELKRFSKYKQLNIVTIYGGLSINPQIEELKTADVVIGTPGRTLDHLERRTINLNNVNTLVLDEADIMLDMGFIDDVKKITSQCPAAKRQTLLFSATIHGPIELITKKYMKNPIKVSVESYVDPKKLKQVYYDVPASLKFSLLVHLLKQEREGLVMVFCNTRRYVDIVARGLRTQGIDAMEIHGGLTQAARNKIMERFNSGKACILVCTDVAARGLDIHDVSHVYNYDVPNEAKQYVHRIGRTARAGAKGNAITILADVDHDNFYRVLRDTDVKVKKAIRPKIPRIDLNTKPVYRERVPGGGQRGGPRRGGPRRGGPRRGPGGPRKGGQGGPRRHSGGPKRGGPRRSGPRRGGR